VDTASLRRVPDRVVSFRTLVSVVAARWPLFLLCTGTFGVLAGVWSFLSARKYSSTASFIVQMRTQQSNMASVAAQFGFALANEDPTQSANFYIDLLHSRTVLQVVAEGPYQINDSLLRRRGDLGAVLNFKVSGNQARLEKAMDWLDKHLKTDMSLKTNVVTVSTTAPSPALAQAILVRVLAELNAFNLERRQSQASAERKFVGDRLAATQSDLRAAEDRLLAFQESNRSTDIPRLRLAESRLNQNVTMLQEVYTTLSQTYEQAKIDEVRDTPVINVIDPPEYPLHPDGRGIIRMTLLGFMGGGLCCLLVVFIMLPSRSEETEGALL
jgi:uncharacterized protein involved in exopolysaccharide biosynthesis